MAEAALKEAKEKMMRELRVLERRDEEVVERMRMHGRSVQVVGLNEASADLVDRHGATDRTGVEIGLAPHP